MPKNFFTRLNTVLSNIYLSTVYEGDRTYCSRNALKDLFELKKEIQGSFCFEPETTVTPDYCFMPDDLDDIYAWSGKDTLVMDLEPGDSMEISCLKELPSRWVCCVVKDSEWVTLWFDTEEEMLAKLNDWRGQQL